jgi:prepilin-type N-terminal cleavage/methylation domain-containing protein
MDRRGFTLIETLIAIVVLTITVLSLGKFMGSFQNTTAKATMVSTMTAIAKERVELVRADPRYTRLVNLYGTGASADTTGFPGYSTMRRVTITTRDQTGAPARDFTTVTVRVTIPLLPKDTVALTAVIARP